MTEDDAPNSANEHQDDRKSPHDPVHEDRHITYVVFLSVLYIVVDFYFCWPQNHLLALVFLAVGISAVAFRELPRRWRYLGIGAVWAACLIARLVAGPVIPPPVEVTGTLQPGNEPTPPNACDQPGVPPDTSANAPLKIIMGNDNVVEMDGMGTITAIEIASCPVLSITRTPSGVSVNAKLYDKDGDLIASVVDNSIDVMTGQNVSMSRAGDLTRLVVSDGGGNELLNVRYINETTILARGVFGCPGHRMVAVTDGGILPNNSMSNFCAEGEPGDVGIGIDYDGVAGLQIRE